MNKLKMRVTILAVGSRGDVQPYVALGQGLQRAGYRVRLGIPSNMEPLVTQYGLDFAAIAPNSQQLMARATGRAMMTTGQNGIDFIFKLTRMVRGYAQQILLAAWDICQDTDVIIFNAFALIGAFIAEKLNIPVCAAWIYPLSRTRFFPAMGTPVWLRLGGTFNWCTYLFYEQIIQLAFRQIFREWRQMLGLSPLPPVGYYDYLYRQQIPILYAYSPTVVPRPGDWPERFVVSGYWFLDRPAGWQPPTALVDFLVHGPAPVYVGFGSMSGHRSKSLVDVVVDALNQTGQRGILARGWGGLETRRGNQRLTDNIFVIDNAPHDWLFPQMAAVAHHGGAGTTAAGLRAGLPSVIVPFSGDQPFWGRRVTKLGVGPVAVPYKNLSVSSLATAIQTVTANQTMRQQAATLGQRIQNEEGVLCAIEAFKRYSS
jgi:UDP:flavonoid glycosyltransferase YjiC (YdhE family)